MIHDSKDSSATKCSNLEVKKKSPLIGAGELRLKRETIPFMSLQHNVMSSPKAYMRNKVLLGEMSPFYREGTSPILRHSVSITFSLLIDIGLGIH